MASTRPTFARYANATKNPMVNFQLVEEYLPFETLKIEIKYASGRIVYWEFGSESDRDDAITKLDDLYTDAI